MLGLVLPELDEEEEPEHFEVFKSNWPILNAFFVLDGCAWQYTGMGDLIGLDYQAAQVIWSYAGIALTPPQFNGLMLFARTVVTELNKNKK